MTPTPKPGKAQVWADGNDARWLVQRVYPHNGKRVMLQRQSDGQQKNVTANRLRKAYTMVELEAD